MRMRTVRVDQANGHGGQDRCAAAPVRRALLLVAVAFGLLALSALASGAPADVGWLAAVLGVVVLVLTLPRWTPFGRLLRGAIGVYALALTSATLLVGQGLASAGDGPRVVLFSGNPNLLGAGLVASFAAWAAVAPGRRWVWWGWPLVALAVLHTGSRTAGAALLVAAVAWAAREVACAMPRGRVLGALTVISLPLLAAGAWQWLVVERIPNLLAAPNDVADPAWNHDWAAALSVTPDATTGPYEGTRAQRVQAQARDTSSLVLLQGLGVSEDGVPYVASVYLRSDVPQRVGLSSHLSSVTCEVDTEWRRCVTPVGYGNGVLMRQHRFLTDARGGAFDVYVFGAQYERGDGVTPFLDVRPSWLPQTMVNRFDMRRVSWLPAARVEAARAGLAAWREQPVFGVGRVQAIVHVVQGTDETHHTLALHAHNQGVQTLLEDGLMGAAGWLLVMLAFALAIPAPGWWRLAPLLLATLVLNAWDASLFDRTGFYATIAALGLWSAGGAAIASGPPRRDQDVPPGRSV